MFTVFPSHPFIASAAESSRVRVSISQSLKVFPHPTPSTRLNQVDLLTYAIAGVPKGELL